MTEPIRVLRVIARLNVGGPALHVTYLGSELDRLGYETTLVAGRVSADEGSMEHIAEQAGLHPIYLPELQREISPLLDVNAVRSLLRLIRELKPDVLHTHTAKAGAVGRAAALLAGSDRPRAVVHTFHGHVLRGYFPPRRAEMFARLEQGLARSTDALVAVSPQVRDDLVALGVAPPERIVVIRLGLDLVARTAGDPDAGVGLRRELDVPETACVVGWLGRMTEIKRVDRLVAAFAQLAARRPDAYLLLAGDGPLRGRIEAQIGELGLRDRCRLVGFREDVASVFAASDVMALTSANEGTPVSLIEASAAGLPLVSTDVGGVRDMLRDGETGFLVTPDDLDGFADRLAVLADDPKLRRRLGDQGRAFVVPRYAIERLVGDVDGLYRELLTPRSGRAPRLTRALARTPRRAAGERTLRVLLLSQYFPPEVGATQTRMQAFAEYLADRGHAVTVVCEFPNHPHGVVPPGYRGRLVEDDRSNAYRVLRVWVKASEEKTQRNRLAFYLSYMGLATAVAPLVGRVEVVLATSPPLFTGLAGATIARAKRAPFVLDVRDLWPAAATSLRQISPGLVTHSGLLLERSLYRAAAEVVAVTRPFCEHIDAIRGPSRPGAHLIPNGTLDLFFEEPAVLDRLGVPPEQFLLTFAGTHGIAQALLPVLDAAARLERRAHIAFVGDGPVKEIVVAEAARRRLDNVSFHPQLPLERIMPVLAGSDALLVPLSAHPTFAAFVPSKLIDFMAAGRPVILSAAGESARILTDAGAGLVVRPEDPEALAAAVDWLADHPAEAGAMGRRGREFADAYRRSAQAAELEHLLLDLTAPGQRSIVGR